MPKGPRAWPSRSGASSAGRGSSSPASRRAATRSWWSWGATCPARTPRGRVRARRSPGTGMGFEHHGSVGAYGRTPLRELSPPGTFPKGAPMKADLLISNARIVSPGGTYRGHVYVEGGQIAAITKEKDAGARREIDAGGRHIIPGMVDEHVHMMDPGFTDREDWTRGTQAAARGGITTVID